ncbi:MAG TPA: SCO family protein [Caulobacteraceae bacterium]|nr:SCO family protein [Caulobacteraceae bacterium]
MSPRIVQVEPAREARSGRNRVAAIAAGVLAGLLALIGVSGLEACAPRATATASPATGGPGGPFNLVDENGRPVDQSILKGKWSLVFFGYTYCPDVCPTTLTMLGRTMAELGPRARNVQVVFITVDPARDTPSQLKTYMTSPVFPKNMIGLTGTPAQTAQAARAYDVYYQKHGTGANYTLDHSVVVYLMDPEGRFNRPIPEDQTPQQTARQIDAAMNGA